MFDENEIEYSYPIKCKLCEQEMGNFIRFKIGYVFEPILPDGWNKLNGEVYCDRHEIIIR